MNLCTTFNFKFWKSTFNEPKALPALWSVLYLLFLPGLRLLDENATRAIVSGVEAAMSDASLNPFVYAEEYVHILSGEEEALYAWITVNYLNHYFEDRWATILITRDRVLFFFIDAEYTFEPRHEKTCLCHMRTTKAQISLRIRAWVVRCFDSIIPLLVITKISRP